MKTNHRYQFRLLTAVTCFSLFAQLPLSLRADATDDFWRRDAARREDEQWRKSVYGQEGGPSTMAASSASYKVIMETQYAAIAFSSSTGSWGYAYEYTALAAARKVAVARCKSDDANVVAWASGGWYCALALGREGAYGGGSGPNAAIAKARALEECMKHGVDCTVVACVRSGEY